VRPTSQRQSIGVANGFDGDRESVDGKVLAERWLFAPLGWTDTGFRTVVIFRALPATPGAAVE